MGAPLASAHAYLITTNPADGAAVGRAPKVATFTFDEGVGVAGGNAAVANTTSASVAAGPAVARGRVLRIPLRAGLARGAYTVRWSIVSDDGHHEAGVIAFAVGTGGPTPVPVLSARLPLRWNVVALRTLWYAGILAAAGAAVFALLTRRVARLRTRSVAHLFFFALLAAFVGGGGILQEASGANRFASVVGAGTALAGLGAFAAALAPRRPRLLVPAGAAALLLLLVPTLSGHALDASQPAVLAPLLDLAHLAAAAVWLGGLLCVVILRPGPDALRRFSRAALVSIAVLAGTGAGRALTELGAFSQLWTTSYGRVLLAKTVLFAALLGLGAVARRHVQRGEAPARAVRVELVLAGGLVVAVAVLTLLAPGAGRRTAVAVPPTLPLGAPPPPPAGAVVDARELGRLAVAVARTPGEATVTVLGGDGGGAEGLRVEIDGVPATRCGAGCYRAATGQGPLLVSVGRRVLRFSLPATTPDATQLLERATRAFRSSRSVVFDETLASTPRNASTTRFELLAPNRLAYVTRGGPAAVVLGARRWDRVSPAAPWRESAQTPLDVPTPYWRHPTNVHLVAPRTLTFYEPAIPAWFRVRLSPHGVLPVRTGMTAAAHFMVDRYRGYGEPLAFSPPR